MRCITFCERQQGVCIYHENIKNSQSGFMRHADRACGGTAVYGRRNTLRSVFHVRRAYSDCSRRSYVRHGGGWLGLVFGAVVLLTDSTLFMAFSIPGTVVTVLLKGVLCGLCSALVFKALKKANTYLAVIAAAIT